MDIFEKATRLKLRFDTIKGPLSVEHLWDLPLTSETGKTNLDDIARALHLELKNDRDVSFVVKERKSDETTQLAFDLVKHVIDVRLEERKKASEESERKERRQKIMAILDERKDQDLRSLPMDELKKLLAET